MAELDEILYQLGVYPTQRGYQITNMAVTIGWREPEKLQMLTKWLYPAVALKCGCSNAAVERNLRATVNRAWDTNPGSGFTNCEEGACQLPHRWGFCVDALQVSDRKTGRSVIEMYFCG